MRWLITCALSLLLTRSATPSPPGTRTPASSSTPTGAAQYTSADFASLAEDYQVVLSLGRTGQCWDNALAESFFALLEGELIDLQAWPARAAARRAIVEYIGWYNGTRSHSTLGHRLSPRTSLPPGKEDLGQED